jgi:hypothetical protein
MVVPTEGEFKITALIVTTTATIIILYYLCARSTATTLVGEVGANI